VSIKSKQHPELEDGTNDGGLRDLAPLLLLLGETQGAVVAELPEVDA
jgi:hypothetical protein